MKTRIVGAMLAIAGFLNAAESSLGGYRSTISVELAPYPTVIPLVPIRYRPPIVRFGQDVEISLSSGKVTSVWYKDGVALHSSERVQAEPTRLRISGFQQSDVGTYSADGSDGVRLVSESDGRLLNVSTLGFVSPGRPMTVGMYINTDGTNAVLVRAIGSTLKHFGVKDTLNDPVLQVFDSKGEEVGIQADVVINYQNESEVGAFPRDPDGGEPHGILRLGTGTYTFVVSSKSGASGSVLVEIYEVKQKS